MGRPRYSTAYIGITMDYGDPDMAFYIGIT